MCYYFRNNYNIISTLKCNQAQMSVAGIKKRF